MDLREFEDNGGDYGDEEGNCLEVQNRYMSNQKSILLISSEYVLMA